METQQKPPYNLGWLPDLPDQRDIMYAAPMAVMLQLPTSADLRNQCPPVYDQGHLGSCTANGLAAAYEFDLKKQNKTDFMPSRLFIYYNERVLLNTVNSDSGAYIRDGIKTMNQQGVCPENDWAYDIGKFTVKPPAKCYTEAKKCQIKSYQRLNKAQQLAEQYIREHTGKDTELQFHAIRLGKTCGGGTKGSGELDKEYVTDTTVEFRQVINGVPVINTDNGVVRVTIDNDGTITNFHNSVKKVLNLSNKPKEISIDPNRNGHALETQAQETERLFRNKLSEYKTENAKPVANEVGYDISGLHGSLSEKREYEVTFENDLKKLIQVTVPIFA